VELLRKWKRLKWKELNNNFVISLERKKGKGIYIRVVPAEGEN